MNRTDRWCSYLTDQMHEKHGFPKEEAHRMVCGWLKSIKNTRTHPDGTAAEEIVSCQVPLESKTAASAKV